MPSSANPRPSSSKVTVQRAAWETLLPSFSEPVGSGLVSLPSPPASTVQVFRAPSLSDTRCKDVTSERMDEKSIHDIFRGSVIAEDMSRILHRALATKDLSSETLLKIQSGKYLGLHELLPENIPFSSTRLSRLDPEEMVKTDILLWFNCFSIYTGHCVRDVPFKSVALTEYARIIVNIYQAFSDPTSWWRYDIAFRRKLHQINHLDWSAVDSDLLAFATTPRLRDSLKCLPCLSMDHVAEDCPFREVVAAIPDETDPDSIPASKSGTPLPSSPDQGLLKVAEGASPDHTRSSSEPRTRTGLQIKYAFGYHGHSSLNNVFYTRNDEVVYHTAGLGVCFNCTTKEQRFYSAHDDDVLCLAVQDDKDIVATGQIGKEPKTHVWSLSTMKTLAVLKGFHRCGVIIVDFSQDGSKLADVGNDDDHCICVWDWRKQEKLATCRGFKDRIYNLEWNPYNSNEFVVVGVKHIRFWTHNGAKLDKKITSFGKAGQIATMLCVCFSPYDNLCFTGSETGEVYIWQASSYRRSVPAHKGPVSAIFGISMGKEGFITGGGDGAVVIWDDKMENALRAFRIESKWFPQGTMLISEYPGVRAVHTLRGKIVVGTADNQIIEILPTGQMEILVQGHNLGEVWGLATHPKKMECSTISDDKSLRVWDLEKFRLKSVLLLKVGGRALEYSPNGEYIAYGLNNGYVNVISSDTFQALMTFHDRVEEISDIKFSPDGVYFAAASHDNFVDVYLFSQKRRRCVLRGSSSYVTHLDWDVHGQLVQTNSGAREHLFFEIPSGERKTVTGSTSAGVEWTTQTCVLGPTVAGIFPPRSDITDVNACSRSHDGRLLASGDDFGKVNIFDFPVPKQVKPLAHPGHCSHVTNVRWTINDSFLVSTGGLDCTLVVWEKISVPDVEAGKEEARATPNKVFLPSGTIKRPISKGKPIWT